MDKLQNKKELKEWILSDLYRYYGKTDRKTYLKARLFNYGFRYMRLHRKSYYYSSRNRFFYYFYSLLLRRYTVKYGYEIPPLTRIGRGFFIGHLGAIAVNSNCIIGDNVNISKGVTIGQENRGDRRGCPVIGSCVWIGANAAVVGRIKVGSNVLIAPNAYVNFDVEDYSIVLGNPGRIIPAGNETVESYITYRYERKGS